MGFSEKAKESLNAVIEKFETGDLSPVARIALLQRTKQVPFDNWTLANKVLAFCQSGSLDLRGYKQWKGADRQVKKGTKAAFILAPRIIKVEEENKKGEKEERTKCVGFFSIPVFPVENTEGEPVDYGYEEFAPPPLLDVAEYFGVGVEYQPLESAAGRTFIKDGDIKLASPDEAVFFHKLAHAIRTKQGKLKSELEEDYAKEEIIAQMAATVLAMMYGRDITGTTEKYLSHYINGTENPLKAIMAVLTEIEEVLGIIAQVKEKGGLE